MNTASDRLTEIRQIWKEDLPTALHKRNLRTFILVLLCIPFFSVSSNSVVAQQMLQQVITSIEYMFDVQWQPNGSTIAVASSEGVIVYNSQLQEITRLQAHTSGVTAVAWHPEGIQLATAGGTGDSTVRIWNWNGTTSSFTLNTTLLNNNEYKFMVTLAWSPDGSRLATLGVNQPPRFNGLKGRVQLWNTATWTLEKTFEEQVNPIWQLTWSPNSRLLVYQYEYGFEYITAVYDVISAQEVFNDSFVEERGFAFASNETLLMGNGGRAIFKVNLLNGETTRDSGNTLNLTLRLSVDGTRLASATSEGDIRIINPTTFEQQMQFQAVDDVRDLDWDSTSSRLAVISFDGTVQMWRVEETAP